MSLASNALIDVEYLLQVMELDEDDTSTPTETFEVFINAASQLIADLCNREFVAGSTSDIFDGNNSIEYFVVQANITTTPTVFVWDGDSFEATTYVFTYEAATGRVYFTDGNIFYAGKNNWKVTYAYGYAAIPNDVKLACAVLAMNMRKTSKKTGIRSESYADVSTAYDPTALPELVRTVIEKYAVVTYG